MQKLITFFAVLFFISAAPSYAGKSEDILRDWYVLVLKLVRHTPNYTPPVASRNFAYLGITSYEAIASMDENYMSLAGQLNGLEALPKPEAGLEYENTIVLNSAMAIAMENFFGNTGPSGQNALRAKTAKLNESAIMGVDLEIAKRSRALGEAIATHIFKWSKLDGGAEITNMGFPLSYELSKNVGHWSPTNQQGMQQFPLLPTWGTNRPFAMPMAQSCEITSPIPYNENPDSAFYKEALEVMEVKKNITEEQILIAKFWSDDAMLSTTPPGHWVSIFMQISERENLDAGQMSNGLARLGIAVADGFIGCWHAKFEHDLLRPVTFIRAHIDPKWEPLLITPPFPEYPSGHSVQSGAAVQVLEDIFGKSFEFNDLTYEPDGMGQRHFANFDEAAKEAANSRLYGGIHFRAAIDHGLEQGRCIGEYAVKLKTIKP